MYIWTSTSRFSSLCCYIGAGTAVAVGATTGEQPIQGRSSCSPNKIIGGATSTSAPPIFFCSLQFKVTQKFLTQKILENSSASVYGALPQRPHCTLRIAFSKKYILHKVILWISLCWLFFTNFCFPNRKVVQFCSPAEKSLPRPCAASFCRATADSATLFEVTVTVDWSVGLRLSVSPSVKLRLECRQNWIFRRIKYSSQNRL